MPDSWTGWLVLILLIAFAVAFVLVSGDRRDR